MASLGEAAADAADAAASAPAASTRLQTSCSSLQAKLEQLVAFADTNNRAGFVNSFVPLDLSKGIAHRGCAPNVLAFSPPESLQLATLRRSRTEPTPVPGHPPSWAQKTSGPTSSSSRPAPSQRRSGPILWPKWLRWRWEKV